MLTQSSKAVLADLEKAYRRLADDKTIADATIEAIKKKNPGEDASQITYSSMATAVIAHLFSMQSYGDIDTWKKFIPTENSTPEEYDVHLSRIYRYMDKLYNRQMERVQDISIAHTRQILGGSIGLLFYDVTTLYCNLEMRPMFHFTERRIEAHVCICFIAYKVYKELERIIRLSGIGLSVDKVIDIAKTIVSIDIKTDGVNGTARRTLFLTEEQKIIQPLFDLEKLVSRFG